MSKPLLSLCSIPKVATRDGWAGPTAHFILPFGGAQGIWFADGKEYTFPGSTSSQYLGSTINATTKHNKFDKDCCSGIQG